MSGADARAYARRDRWRALSRVSGCRPSGSRTRRRGSPGRTIEPDWPGKFEPIPWVYAEIVRVLHAHERVEILCDDEDVQDEARDALVAHGVSLDRVRLHVVPTDRVWLRDSGADRR